MAAKATMADTVPMALVNEVKHGFLSLFYFSFRSCHLDGLVDIY